MAVCIPENAANEQRKRVLAEELWLNYFNCVLFENGLITESERNRMVHLIANRSSGAERQKRRMDAQQS